MDTSPAPSGPPVQLSALDDDSFLDSLRSNGIGIVAAEDRLRLTAAPGLLTDELKEELRRRKPRLVALLQESPTQGSAQKARYAERIGRGQLEQVRYWKSKLAGVPPLLELPFSRTRPTVKSPASGVVTLQFASGQCHTFRELALAEDVPTPDAFVALVAILFYRYTGQEDFCIGVPAMPYNQLALRCHLRPEMTFRELARQVRATAIEAHAHKTLPFQQLIGHVAPANEPGVPPLFQAMVEVTEAGSPSDARNLWTIARTGLDLIVHLHENGAASTGEIEYSTDLFEAADMEQMARTLGALLESVAQNPDLPIAELPLLTIEERQRVLIDWNRTAVRIQPTELLHHLFERQAVSMPGAIALIEGTTQVTYRQLNERANRLANLLLRRGLQPEECVGVCMHRTSELIVALLAILKAGGAYVPLDPTYPPARIETMLGDSRARLVISESAAVAALDSALSHQQCVLLSVDLEAEAIAGMSAQNPALAFLPDRLAYVIYTSGSTGKPKGVAIEHHSAVSLMHWGNAAYQPEELARVVAATSVCFDLSVFEIFVPLSWGYTVVLASSPLDIVSVSQSAKATLINTVPSAVAAAMASDSFPRSVRCVNMAGEPLAASLVQLVEKRQLEQGQIARGQKERRSVRVRIVDLYGPTETTTYSTASQRRGDLPATIGRPIANTSVFLLDSRMQPVPPGVPGQLCIGGEGVARGYLHQPEMTAQRFVTVPNLPGAPRLYQTGDLARYRPDGNLEYLGRMDNQVKVRGFRIELGEIEGVLRCHPAISEAIVVVQGDTMVAFLVASGAEPSFAELAALQRKSLPAYMVVSEILFLDRLPLTLNGKVDRKLLAATRSEIRSDSAPRKAQVDLPLTEVEQHLVRIWERHFKRSPIDIDDDFFALGGHSLLALKIFSEIEKTLSTPMLLSVLFKAPTIRLLAAEIEAERAKA